MLNKILKVLIYLTVFLMPVFFLPFSFEVLEFNKLYMFFFLAWLSVLLWFLKMIIQDKEIRIRFCLVDYIVLAFVGVGIISSIFSVDKLSSIFGYYGRFSTGLVSMLSFAVFYFLVANNIGKEKLKTKNEKSQIKIKKEETGDGIITISGVIKTLIYSATVVIVFAYFSLLGIWAKIAQISSGTASIVSRIALRVSPAGLTAQSMAMFLAIILILAVFVILGGQKWSGFSSNLLIGDKKKDRRSRTFKIFCGVVVFLGFILLIITDFTPAWIILAIGLIVLTAIILKRRIFKNEVHRLILPIAIIIVSALFVILNFRALAGGLVTNNENIYYNFMPERNLTQGESWQTALNTTIGGFKNALIGSGPGTFYYDFSKYRPVSMNEGNLWAIRFDRSGNVFSEILATMGILGFLSFIALAIAIFLVPVGVLARKFTKTGIKPGRIKLDHGTAFLMVIFAAIILVQFSYYQTLTLGFLFWLFAGLVVGWRAEQLVSEERTFVKEIRFRLKDFMEMALVVETFLIVFAIAFIVVGFFGMKFYLADTQYVKALNAPELDSKVSALQKAIRLNPGQARYQIVLSKVFLAKVQEGLAVGNPNEQQQEIIDNIRLAQAFAMNATQVTPQQMSAWQSLADLYRRTMEIAQDSKQFANLTIDTLKKASELDPRNPDIYTQIGNMYLLLEQREEAMEAFKQAIQQKVDYIPANISIALLLEGDKKIDEAVAKLEWLALRYPSNADVLFQLGRMYYNQNETEKAVNQFLFALTANPNHSNSLYSLGVAYEKQGRIKDAISAFEAVLVLNPDVQEIKDRIAKLKQPSVVVEEEE
ncbi:tetratricopeptide repeat protein [Patescibacteria group bacterium]|nr:tetratricopeptide repeat protein [Patescibacteria group bacterium]MBU4162411.1 tetratricopeptide repeat protein [Patescibacteria group bacterium]